MTLDTTPPTIAVTDFARPFATIGLAVKRGALEDPPGQEGVAFLTAQMLQRGSVGYTRPEMAEAIDHLGSSIDLSVGRDHTTLWADGLTRNREPLLRLIEHVLHKPTFPVDELEKLKRETIADLAALRDDDASLGMRFFARHLYGDHLYGRPMKGTESTLAAIQPEDLARYHRTWTADRVLVAMAGDIAEPEQRSIGSRLVAGLGPTSGADVQVASPAPTKPGWRVLIVDKPQRTQTQVFIGQLTIDAMSRDWTPLQVGQTSFGGTFTSRFSHEIREKRGWSYGAWSQVSGDQRLGTFMLRFYPTTKDTVPALALTDELLTDFCKTGPTADEFANAQSYLQNGFVFAIDTAVKRLAELVSSRLLGHPDDHVDSTVDRLKRVSYEHAVEAVQKHLRPADMAITIVGTASELEKDLRQLERVVSVDVVDWQADFK
jgi:zinc protease